MRPASARTAIRRRRQPRWIRSLRPRATCHGCRGQSVCPAEVIRTPARRVRWATVFPASRRFSPGLRPARATCRWERPRTTRSTCRRPDADTVRARRFKGMIAKPAALFELERALGGATAATLPRSSSLRSVRATTEWQYSQMVTRLLPVLNVTGAPQAGQGASTGRMEEGEGIGCRVQEEGNSCCQPRRSRRAFL